jgi:hypothetical protein
VGLETHWRGQSDTNRARLVWVLVGSLLLHSPLTPLFTLIGWFLQPPPEAAPVVDPITAIPVELLEGEDATAAAKAAQKEPAAPEEPAVSVDPAPAATEKVPVRDAGAPVDAGAPDAEPEADAGEDAGPPDAGDELADGGIDDGGGLADAGPPEDGGAGEGDAGTGEGGPRDPIALVGEAQKVVGNNGNVQVIIDTEKVRAHPLGSRIGGMLAAIPQWRDFLGHSQIDAVRDFDRLVISAPQLVADSSELVAILFANVPDKQLRAAVDALVQADPKHGEWKKKAPVPTAIAYADRAPRVFVLPSPGVVVVTPPSAEKAAQGLRKLKTPSLPGEAVLRGKLVTPANAAKGLPIRLPASLKSVKVMWFTLTPTVSGGVLIELEADDGSPEQASENAAALTSTIRSIPLNALFIDRYAFEADGSKIKGTIALKQQQVLMILSTIEMQLLKLKKPGSTGGATPDPGTPR